MATEGESAPKVWRGRFFEDFDVGDVFRSRFGRTITETDNIWFTCLTHEHEPDALQHALRGAHALRAAARQQRVHARAGHRA